MSKGHASVLPERAACALREAAQIENELERRKAVDLAIAKARRDFPGHFREQTDDEIDRVEREKPANWSGSP